jgi:hypothetical protein
MRGRVRRTGVMLAVAVSAGLLAGCDKGGEDAGDERAMVAQTAASVAAGEAVPELPPYAGAGPHKCFRVGNFIPDSMDGATWPDGWNALAFNELQLVADCNLSFVDTGKTWTSAAGVVYPLQKSLLTVILREARTAGVVGMATWVNDRYPSSAEVSSGYARPLDPPATLETLIAWFRPYIENPR